MTRPPDTTMALFTVLAMLAGATLRLWLMLDRELTFDEAATAYFANLPFTDLWGEAARLETNPPLFYSIAWALARTGLPAEFNRLAALVPDVLAIGLGTLLALRLGSRPAAIIAACLLATSPMMVNVALDARAYALLELCGLACILLTLRVADGARTATWALLVLAEVAALYTHNTAVIMLLR